MYGLSVWESDLVSGGGSYLYDFGWDTFESAQEYFKDLYTERKDMTRSELAYNSRAAEKDREVWYPVREFMDADNWQANKEYFEYVDITAPTEEDYGGLFFDEKLFSTIEAAVTSKVSYEGLNTLVKSVTYHYSVFYGFYKNIPLKIRKENPLFSRYGYLKYMFYTDAVLIYRYIKYYIDYKDCAEEIEKTSPNINLDFDVIIMQKILTVVTTHNWWYLQKVNGIKGV